MYPNVFGVTSKYICLGATFAPATFIHATWATVHLLRTNPVHKT